jgi:hypothetical protein
MTGPTDVVFGGTSGSSDHEVEDVHIFDDAYMVPKKILLMAGWVKDVGQCRPLQ